MAADPKCIQISSCDDYLQQPCYETVIKLSHAAVAAIYFAQTEMLLSLLYNDLGIHRHFFFISYFKQMNTFEFIP